MPPEVRSLRWTPPEEVLVETWWAERGYAERWLALVGF